MHWYRIKGSDCKSNSRYFGYIVSMPGINTYAHCSASRWYMDQYEYRGSYYRVVFWHLWRRSAWHFCDQLYLAGRLRCCENSNSISVTCVYTYVYAYSAVCREYVILILDHTYRNSGLHWLHLPLERACCIYKSPGQPNARPCDNSYERCLHSYGNQYIRL